ncbi:MAG: phage tail tube protein [Oscillospiraceae bacterium]
MSKKPRGNQTLSGTWAEVWVNGDKIWELNKIEAKVTANREDVQIDFDVDSKMTGLKGEITMGVKKVYSRYTETFEAWKRGEDIRCQVITKLADPDAIGKQQERYSIDNIWFNELPLVNYEKGGIIEEEISGGFTPSDMINLDRIS